jgi:hypothetical protein
MNHADTGYRLTYATMFDPPPSLHQRFDAALAQVRQQLGAVHGMHIGGRTRLSERWFELRSPIDHQLLLGRFALGSAADVADAVAAARAAAPGWAATPYAQRIERLRQPLSGSSGRARSKPACSAIWSQYQVIRSAVSCTSPIASMRFLPTSSATAAAKSNTRSSISAAARRSRSMRCA